MTNMRPYFLIVKQRDLHFKNISKKIGAMETCQNMDLKIKSLKKCSNNDKKNFFYFLKKVLIITCLNPKTVLKKVSPVKSYEFLKKSYFDMSKHRLPGNFFSKFDFSLPIGDQTSNFAKN